MNKINSNYRRKILSELIEDLGAEIRKDDYIIINKDELYFKIYFWGNLVYVGYRECKDCDLDCNKEIVIEVNYNIEKWKNIDGIKYEDKVRLAKIDSILNNYEKINSEIIKDQLLEQLKNIKFIIIGFNFLEIKDIFEKAPGEKIEIDFLPDSYCKIIETFPQLIIELYMFSKRVFNNLLSNRPAPILLDFIKNIYGFITISDSTTKDVMNIKNKILPALYQHNPFALNLILSLYREEPGYLSPELMQKILNRKVYPIPYDNKIQSFMELLYKSTLLRIDQMKESGCPFINE